LLQRLDHVKILPALPDFAKLYGLATSSENRNLSDAEKLLASRAE
jgi:hypothetical protein